MARKRDEVKKKSKPRQKKKFKIEGVDFFGPPKIDEPGGEKISVSINVNGNLHYKRESVLHGKVGQREVYKTDDGDFVKVRRARGVKEIVCRLLKDKGTRDV